MFTLLSLRGLTGVQHKNIKEMGVGNTNKQMVFPTGVENKHSDRSIHEFYKRVRPK